MLQIPPNVTCCGTNDSPPSSPVIKKEVRTISSKEFAIPLKDEASTDADPLSLQPLLPDPIEVKQGTPLYSAIESEKWENAILFLETGSFFGWGENALSLFGLGEKEAPQDPKVQVRTWVVGNDWWGNVASKRLPIHAAVVKKAPITLIEKLIEMYPESIRCKDLEGNLPLHLSFKYNSPDGVVALLLKSYPEAVGEKNIAGHQPVDYASADACEIIQLCVDQTNKVAKREEARLCQALESEKSRLTEILSQLSEIRGELDHLRKSKMKEPSISSTRDEPAAVTATAGAAAGAEDSASPQEPVDTQKESPKEVVAVRTKKQKSDRKLRFRCWRKKKVIPA